MPRRSRARPRTFSRARRFKRGGGSRRRLLNVTSTKKQDNMLPQLSSSTSPSVLTFTSNTYVLYCPSARPLNYNNGIVAYGPSARESTVTFARGYKERSHVQLQGQYSCLWRRIVYLSKGLILEDSGTPITTSHQDVANGMVRLVNTLSSGQTTETFNYIFKGTVNVDWYDPFVAKTDSNRIKLISDKTIALNPAVAEALGGSEPPIKSFRNRNWYPVNKNMIYSDTESGTGIFNDSYSSNGIAGCGDLYILDMFNLTGSGGNQQVTFSPEGTYYWHEK